MIISLNWLKYWSKQGGVEINTPTEKLVELIGARLVEVEGTEDISEKYHGIKIVEIKTAEKIDGSDHLTKCIVFDGKNEEQVVCGAPNVRVGMLAVWLPPKTVLPSTYNEEPLVLDKRKLMGVESAGMLAAMDELDLGTDHDGIIEIDSSMAKAGDDFMKLFELDDTMIDIENKSLTHRPDCFGVIGIAREVAGILGQEFKTPDWLMKTSKVELGDEVKIEAEVMDSVLCPRYQAVVLGLANKQAKNYLSSLQTFIARSGTRSIDRVVDITNELMLLTGQPLHAFDYDKLVAVGGTKTPKIIIRAAKKDEELELLDGKTIKMADGDIVITSNNVPIALAGAMGGMNTAIDKNTKRIVLESATFNLFNMRGTQFRHGIKSEAITRFTKGQPPALTDYVIRAAIDAYKKYCGARVISGIADACPKPIKNPTIKINVTKINDLLGSDYTVDEIITTLTNVEFKVALKGDALDVTAPYWRTDIHIIEDVIEEVGRLNGFDNISAISPKRDFISPAPDALGDLKSKIRQVLSDSGANEILTYTFIGKRLLDNVGQDPKNSYKIINSISPELQYVRQSLTPSLLEKAYKNVKVPYDHFVLFEINQVFQKKYGLTDEKVPSFRDKVSLVVTDRKSSYDAYYEARRYAEQLLQSFNIKYDFVPLVDDNASNKPYEPKRSAQVKSLDHKICYGVVGEFRQSVRNNMKLPQYTAGFELNIDKIIETAGKPMINPVVDEMTTQDLTVKVRSGLEYIKLENLICDNLSKNDLQFDIKPLGVYQAEKNDKTKNISFRLRFASYDKTLTGDEIADIMNSITDDVKKELKGEVV